MERACWSRSLGCCTPSFRVDCRATNARFALLQTASLGQVLPEYSPTLQTRQSNDGHGCGQSPRAGPAEIHREASGCRVASSLRRQNCFGKSASKPMKSQYLRLIREPAALRGSKEDPRSLPLGGAPEPARAEETTGQSPKTLPCGCLEVQLLESLRCVQGPNLGSGWEIRSLTRLGIIAREMP